MKRMQELLRRLRTGLPWIAAQFWVTLLVVLIAILWTRLPDSHGWQVMLTLLLPLLLLAALSALEAGTMRSVFAAEGKRLGLPAAMLSILIWVCIAALAWWFLDWCDDRTIQWASYLNSKFSAQGRQTIFTFQHIDRWLTTLIWIVRWIVLPAKVIPHAMAAAQWGWRLPWFRVWRLLFNWRWWLAAIAAALIAVDLPSHFFTGLPRGTVSHQVWAVILKLAASYLLALIVWVLSLAWCAVLLTETIQAGSQPAEGPGVPVPVGSHPLGADSIRLPLPETGEHSGGNA